MARVRHLGHAQATDPELWGARHRQLRDRLELGDFSPEQSRRFDLERLCDQAALLEKWSRWGSSRDGENRTRQCGCTAAYCAPDLLLQIIRFERLRQRNEATPRGRAA